MSQSCVYDSFLSERVKCCLGWGWGSVEQVRLRWNANCGHAPTWVGDEWSCACLLMSLEKGKIGVAWGKVS